MKSQGHLICTKQGVSLLLPAKAWAHLTGLEGNARSARQRELSDSDGTLAFGSFHQTVAHFHSRGQKTHFVTHKNTARTVNTKDSWIG